ncbi:MAG: CobW family GTP-binding protein [Thermodesulfobacteriota bacterium]
MTKNLHNLLPPCALKKNGPAAAELLRAVMIRSNFVPNARHRLGWRGVQEIVDGKIETLSFTSRIQNMPGVYGLKLTQNSPGQAKFDLYYFPSEVDPLIEDFCVQAGIIALQPDFAYRVREFCSHNDLCILFKIGSINIDFELMSNSQLLTLEAPDTITILAEDGVRVDTAQGTVQAVKPGEKDQDTAANEIAMHFFRVLAASFCYTQNKEADLLIEREKPDYIWLYSGNGELKKKPSAKNKLKSLTLGINAQDITPEDNPKNEQCIKTIWKNPEDIPPKFVQEPWWGISTPEKANSITRRKIEENKPKLIVLTGFLGSGKTSFLDKFIEKQIDYNAFVAVIQNEIGEKGLDGKLLEQNYAVTEIDEGCVCCTLSGNLRAAAEEIMREHAPDFIVLETTGLANPANILQEIYDLDDILEFGSITCVVDAVDGKRAMQEFEIARSQVRLADAVLLNKSDLADEDHLKQVEEKIHELNVLATVYRTTHGNIHPGLLYGINMHKKASRAQSVAEHENRHTNHIHDHVDNRLLLPLTPLNTSELLQKITKMQAHILRVKGVVELDEESGPVVFQYSPGTYSVEPAPREIKDERYLVVIGQNTGETDIDSLVRRD